MQCRRPRFDPCVRKISWRREWQPTLVFLPREFHGQRTLVGYIHGVAKSQTWLSDFHTHTHTHTHTHRHTQLFITHRVVQDMSSWLAVIFPLSSDLETQANSLQRLLYFSGLHCYYCLHSYHRRKMIGGDCTPHQISWSLCWKGTQISVTHIQLVRSSHMVMSVCQNNL